MSVNDEMSTDLKDQLKPYLESYYKKLQQEISDLLNDKVVGTEITITEKNDTTIQSEANRFSQLFFEFTNSARQIYLDINNANESDVYKTPLSQIIESFNLDGAFNVPLNSQRVRDIFDNGQNIVGDIDSNNKISQLLLTNNIDLRKLTIDLLEYYVIRSVTNSNEFKVENDIGRNKKDLVFVHRNLPLSIKYLIKYRPKKIEDVNELAIESIDELKSAIVDDRKFHIVTIVFSEHPLEDFEKIKFRFSNVIYERAAETVSYISIILAGISRLKEFKETLLAITNKSLGHTIDFKYEDSPLKHGWKIRNSNDTDLSTSLRLGIDAYFEKFLHVKLPPLKQRSYVEYALKGGEVDNFRTIVIYMMPYPNMTFYIDLTLVGRNEKHYFNVNQGNAIPHRTPNSPSTEYLVYIDRKSIGNWFIYQLDIQQLFDQSFGKEDLKLQSISGFRFSGETKIGKIVLL